MPGSGNPVDAPPERYLAVGRVGRAHGLRGTFRVQFDSPFGADRLAGAEHVWIDGLGDARIESFAPHGRDHLLSVDRVRRIETAKRLLHAAVRVPDDAPSPDDPDAAGDERSEAWPTAGTPVVREDGRVVGTVEALDGSPLQPLLRIATDSGPRFLPARAPYVRLDPDVVRLIDPPPGLLDDDA